MEKPAGFRLWVKWVLVYVIFMLLYFAWKFFPVFPLNLFAGISESNFQHYKATFCSFLLADLIEYLVCRKNLPGREKFWYGSLLAAVIAPWVVFLVWYIVPAVYGQWPREYQEIIYANVATLAAVWMSVNLERAFRQMTFTRGLKTIVLFLTVISAGLYLIFTFKLPWADVFVEPDWQEKTTMIWRWLHG